MINIIEHEKSADTLVDLYNCRVKLPLQNYGFMLP